MTKFAFGLTNIIPRYDRYLQAHRDYLSEHYAAGDFIMIWQGLYDSKKKFTNHKSLNEFGIIAVVQMYDTNNLKISLDNV